MKKLALCAVECAVLLVGVGWGLAQASDPKDLTGQWQATAQGPQRGLRLVLLVWKADGGGGKTVCKYINPIAHGTGIPRAAWEVPKPPPPPAPMAANADPSFEVATIKPSNSSDAGKGFALSGRNFSTRNTSLDDLIEYAYDVHLKQIVGGPEWMDKDKFDVGAVPDREGSPSHEQLMIMMQKLLADRFQLKFHHDERELSVYVLSVAEGGPRNLTRSNRADDQFFIPIGPTPGGLMMRVVNGNMQDFSGFGLQGTVLDRPVLDRTGLKGRYDFVLTWLPNGTEFGGRFPPSPPSDNPPPNLFTAIQEQLGMKLAAVKAPADVMVIDKAEKPSAN
jgi:uncharacterized protein (TIGR03435 family)